MVESEAKKYSLITHFLLSSCLTRIPVALRLSLQPLPTPESDLGGFFVLESIFESNSTSISVAMVKHPKEKKPQLYREGIILVLSTTSGYYALLWDRHSKRAQPVTLHPWSRLETKRCMWFTHLPS